MLFLNLPGIGSVAQEVTPTTTSEVLPTFTPVVAPTVGPSGSLSNPLSGDFLTGVAQSDFGPFSTFFLLLGLIALVAGLYFYLVGKNRWRNTHRLNFRLTNTWSLIATVLGGLAVVFVLFRTFGVAGLNVRFWLYLVGLIWAIFIGYAIYYFVVRYKVDLAAFSRTQRGNRVATARSGAGGATSTAPARPKGTAGNPRGTSNRGDRRREKD